MTELPDAWDFYLCRVNGQPASIYVDLALHRVAPLSEYPMLHWATLHMQNPRPDGLSSSEEAPALWAVEEAMVTALKDSAAVYVGRSTSARCREFYFYASSSLDLAGTLAPVLARFPGYSVELAQDTDPEWHQYLNFLYPSRSNRRWMGDRDVVRALTDAGDLLNQPRSVFHYTYFPTMEARQQFLDRVKQDFPPGSQELTETTEGVKQYGVRLEQRIIPTLEVINQITTRLDILSTDCEGEYDGWESELLKPTLGDRLKGLIRR